MLTAAYDVPKETIRNEFGVEVGEQMNHKQQSVSKTTGNANARVNFLKGKQ